MVITLPTQLEVALSEEARRKGVSPESLALGVLGERFLPVVPRDEWERRLFGAAVDCGVSLPDSALGREEMYE